MSMIKTRIKPPAPARAALSGLRLQKAPFLFLAGALSLFLGAAYVERIAAADILGLHVLALLGGLLASGLLFAHRALANDSPGQPAMQAAFTGLSVMGGAVVTRLLSVDAGLGAVLAASIVGLIPGVLSITLWKNTTDPLLKTLPAAIYCGAFAGMTAPHVLGGLLEVAAAGAIAGAVYVWASGVFKGVGGKLGTTAFSGVAITGLLTGTVARFEAAPFAGNGLLEGQGVLVLAAIAGAALTYLASHQLKLGAVVASAGLSLLVGLAFGLPVALPASLAAVPVVFMGGSFAGMSAQEVINNTWLMAFAGLAFGLIFVHTSQFFGGYGGGLGTTACMSVMMACGLTRLAQRVTFSQRVTVSQRPLAARVKVHSVSSYYN